MDWPKNYRCAVCLTFDVDGELVWKSKIPMDPGFGNPVVLSLGEFGPTVAVPRILKLLDTYEIQATFFIPGYILETYPDVVKEIYSRGHEIGFHSYGHVNPAKLTLEQEKKDFEIGLEAFQKLLGYRPYGYRSPAAEMSKNTWGLLAEFGFLYDTTMMGKDFPYVQNVNGKSVIELPMHWILDDWVYFGFNMYPNLPYMSGISSQEKVYEIWSAEFDGMLEEGLLFMLCMHPQLMGRMSRLKMLERLLRHMRENIGVWFAKGVDVAQYATKALK